MKPLIDLPAMNDDAPRHALVERARKRELRARQPKGPVWAVSSRDVEAA